MLSPVYIFIRFIAACRINPMRFHHKYRNLPQSACRVNIFHVFEKRLVSSRSLNHSWPGVTRRQLGTAFGPFGHLALGSCLFVAYCRDDRVPVTRFWVPSETVKISRLPTLPVNKAIQWPKLTYCFERIAFKERYFRSSRSFVRPLFFSLWRNSEAYHLPGATFRGVQSCSNLSYQKWCCVFDGISSFARCVLTE